MTYSTYTRIATFAAAASLFLFQIEDNDLWQHLRTGQYILETRQVPHEDVFSFTAEGQPWVNPSWLADVLFYVAERLMGLNALIVIAAGLCTLALGLGFWAARRRGCGLAVSCAAVLVMALAMRPCALPRPLLATLVFIPTFVLVLDEYLRHGRNVLWVLPALMVFWVNLHGGFMAGLLVVCAYGLGASWRQLKGRTTEVPGRASAPVALWFALGTCILAAMVNPFGVGVFLDAFRLMSSSVFMRAILEWTPPAFEHGLKAYWFALFITVVCVGAMFRHAKAVDVMMVCVFGAMSLRARRHIGPFAVALTPVLAMYAEQVGTRLWNEVKALFPLLGRVNAATLANGTNALVALVAALLLVSEGVLDRNYVFGLGVRESVFPVEGVDFIAQNQVAGNVWNEYGWGGYLMWRTFPERKVFIDGRCQVYGEAVFREWDAVRRCAPGWEELLERRGVNVLLIGHGRPSHELDKSETWRLVFWDDACLVFVKSSPQNTALIRRFDARLTNPALIGERLAETARLGELTDALKRKVTEQPTCALAWENLGLSYIEQKQITEAIESLRRAVALNPHRSATRHNLGYCYYKSGRPRLALDQFKAGLRLRGEDPVLRLSVGDCYRGLGNLPKALAAYEAAARRAPRFPEPRLRMSELFLQIGDRPRAAAELEAALRLTGPNRMLEEKLRALRE